MSRWNQEEAKSYLIGYFLGDGCTSRTENQKDRYRLFATSEDRPLLDEAAAILGVAFNWRPVRVGTPVEVATISVDLARDELWLHKLEGRTSYDKRLPKWDWLDLVETISGFWDADGVVHYGQQLHGSGKPKAQTLGFTIVNPLLAEDLKIALEGLGFHPYLRCQRIKRGDLQCVLRIRRPQIALFRSIFRLQEKKQKKLDYMANLHA